jgi:hypothetical protein
MKKIQINLIKLAKEIVDRAPLNITIAEVFIDNEGEGKFFAKRLIEETVHAECLKLSDSHIMSMTEMEELCADVCLFVTYEAKRRIERIYSLGLSRDDKVKLANPIMEYEVEDEKEYRQVNSHD